MAKTSYERRSPEQWRQLIEAQAVSVQSQTAFCASHGVAKSTFQYWKRRLGARPSPSSASHTGAGLFAPLFGSPESAPESTSTTTGWTIELDLGNGVCLRFRTADP